MADRESQTEAANERRLQRAREDGDVPVSREVIAWAAMATAAAVLGQRGALIEVQIDRAVRTAAGGVDRLPWAELREQCWPLLVSGFWVWGAMALAAVAAGVVQTRGGFWPELAMPRFSRLTSMGALKRLGKGELLVDLGVAAVKVVAIGGAIWAAVSGDFMTLVRLPGADAASELHKVAGLLALVLKRSLLVLALFAGTDFALVYLRHRTKLKMTKDELKRESKEEDGDALIRMRRRRKHRELAKAQARVMVPKADALIVNPTHVAIAIRYRRGADRAPKVVAKGKGVLAELMRELAREHAIPIVEDIALARLLYRRVKIGGEVPAKTYQAVAAILAFVYRVTGRAARQAAQGGLSA